MSIACIDDMSINYECVGDGAATIICVHGGCCDSSDWNDLRSRLSRRFRVVTFDLPGHGTSDLPPTAGIEPLTRTTSEIIRRYGQGNIVLVGHSLGCRVVLEAFHQCAVTIAGLVLIEGPLIPPNDAQKFVAAIEESDASLMNLLTTAFEGMLMPSSDPSIRARVMSRLQRIDRSFTRDILRRTVTWTRRDAQLTLRGIDIPVLMLQSTYTENSVRKSLTVGMTTPWTDLVTETVASTKLRIVPRVGHFPQIDAPDFVSGYIGRFARDCAAVRRHKVLEKLTW